jgi:hypothetical protein
MIATVSTFTPDDSLAVWLLLAVIVTLGVTFLIAKHNTRPRP